MIGLAMPSGIRRHVREHDVCSRLGLSSPAGAEYRFKTLRRRWIEKIELQKLDARNGFHLKNVERNDAAARADAARGDLAPAAWRGAEIDDAGAGFKHFVTLIDFGELERRPRAETFAFGARHIRIADLAREPGARRRGPAFLVLEPRHALIVLRLAPDAVLAHHFDQHAFAQPAIGDAQSLAREGAANGIENGAARKHKISALGADAWIGRALLETHRHEFGDHTRDFVVAEPATVDAPAVVTRQA